MATKTSQTPRASDVINCTAMGLRRAARIVTQAFDDELRPMGLRLPQFSILSILAHGQAHGEDMTVGKMSKFLGMDSSTMTRNLRLLENRRFVETAIGKDRRTRLITLTRVGDAAHKEALPQWQAVQKRLVKKLGNENWLTLFETLELTIEASRQ